MEIDANTMSAMESLSLNKEEQTKSTGKKLKKKKKKRKWLYIKFGAVVVVSVMQ